MSNAERRRASDTISDLVISQVNEVRNQLNQHITDCSTQSRRLFWAVLSLLGWLVVKSLPFAGKMFPMGGP